MKKQWMKALSFVLALVMVLSAAPVAFATEAETTPAGSAGIAYEPWGHGYRFVDVLNWDPETDPYADELVAEVPLQTRIDTYAATQANPNLTDRAKLYAISSSNYRSTDVNEAPWNAGMAYDEFSYNLFKFWQYTDMTGAGGRPTADIERGAGDKEYGTIAIPMAAATNAAHKNGVLSIAEYFLPRNPQYTEEWLQKDEYGNFPYADKLIEIMEFYGFDGYFINQEEAIPVEYVPVMKEIMQYMMDRGAYIQWYDSLTNAGSISYQNIFNSTNSDFVYDTTHGYGQVSHSIFLNYWYKANAIKDSAAHAESLGLDPYETVYMGLEGGEWRFGIDLEDFWDIMYNHNRHSGNLMQEDGQPYTSFAIWGSDFYREQYNKADNNRYKVPYQWEADERERMYFTSPAENAGDYDTTDIRREDLGFTYEDASSDKTKLSTQTNFKGISRYVVEKSVIGGTVFATDFNTGHGMNYYRNGEVIRDTEWSNLNLQDILPTWQWMISSSDDVLLDMEWDYGPEYTRVQGDFPYEQIGGYNGGNSLAIYGSLNGNDSVMLYKTDLQILEGSRLSLTYNKVSPQLESHEMIALLLKSEENEDEVEAVTLPLRSENGGWKTADYGLSRYAGRTVAAIGLIAMGTGVENYQMNLGRLEITDGTDYTPAAPENAVLELALPGTGEYQIAWDLASYDEVKNYHVYAVYADGSYRFVGGAYADEWYVSSLENEDEVVALEVRAVGADGSESEGAQVALPDGSISDIRTVSENNELIVTWQGGEAEVELSYWYSEQEAPAAQTGNGTVTFPVELEDGQKFVLTIDGVPCYFGELADTYAAPYDGEARLQADGKYDLTVPAASDWYSMTTNVGGTYTTYERFGGTKLQDISVPANGLATMIITLTDKDGNVSEPVTKLFFDGLEMDADGGYETLIPDAELRAALEAQAGSTLADLLAFTGELDLNGYAVESLEGLNLVTGLTGLDVSGTAITELVDAHLPTSLTEIVVDGCNELTLIAMPNRPGTALVLGDLPALTQLDIPGYGNFELDLTGAPTLKSISLRGSALRHLDISANTALEVLVMDDSAIASIDHAGSYPNGYYFNWTGAKLDLTAATTEGELFETMKDYFANAELPERKGMNVVTLGNGAGWYNNNNADPSRVIDLGWRHEVTSLTFRNAYNTNQYVNRYNVRNATVEVSDDGENWTLAGTYVQEGWTRENMAEYTTQTIEIPAGTYARYVRFT
ncbi:MAG: discoidin domain-containing protein, partial [Oscillospiraceae bacterium]|nr:discoidin domain-containing protein [Oscillospiraceae bacterium]